jgi:hypothetical protein
MKSSFAIFTLHVHYVSLICEALGPPPRKGPEKLPDLIRNARWLRVPVSYLDTALSGEIAAAITSPSGLSYPPHASNSHTNCWSLLGANNGAGPLVLLCYKRRTPQKRHAESWLRMWRAMAMRSVAMDAGLCRA